MVEFWGGLIGVVVGAFVSIGTQLLALRQQSVVHRREAALTRADRQREAVAKLLSTVTSDVAAFRVRVDPLVAHADDLSLAEGLEEVKPFVGEAADRVRAVAALVADAAVVDAALAVYSAWYVYADSSVTNILNDLHQSTENEAAEASTGAPERFFEASRQYLRQLDT